ncbi:MAG: thiamine ABC transporter substrate-binding protein, partial [Actinobacteria bacterium]|nr:thiamine ABC transporter substrate-binding protein [Actinomycetota bacterium]
MNQNILKKRVLCAALLAIIASACANSSTNNDSVTGQTDTSSQSESSDQITLTLLAYDSFTPSENIFDAFTLETGIKVEIALGGDAGELVTKAALTAGNPQGDVLWGVDNTLLSRAIESKIFSAYKTKNIDDLDESALKLISNYDASPVDTGDVCINYDIKWFTDRKIAPPLTLRALTSASYANLLVVPSPITSSPGLAFMLATIAEFGEDGFNEYWKQLRQNGVLVVDGWNEAYYTEFSGSSGKGERPIVVSYGSSPPAEMIYASPVPATAPTAVAALTCYRQVEFAGVLRGTKHEREAQLLIDYLTS